MASESVWIGASARLTTLIVMRKRTIAITVPIWSWVIIPSQISAISSFGCDVISSAPGFPLIKIGTFTVVFSG